MKKNVLVITNGCPENRIDCAKIEQFLVQNEWIIAKRIRESNLIIFNACGLTEFQQEDSIRLIKKLKRKKETDSKLIVCGCLPMINKERIREIYDGDIFGGDDPQKLAHRLGIKNASNSINANYLIPRTACSQSLIHRITNLTKSLIFYPIQSRRNGNRYKQFGDSVNIVQPNTYYIKISTGCINSCSYCAVKLSRGAIKSKPIEQIKKEFHKGLELGYKQFALIGTDTGSYGHDNQTNLVNLLREITSVEGKFLLKLRNVHPRSLIKMLPGFLDVVKSGKLVHMTTATQHGNNHILQLMKRGYNIEDVKFAIKTLKNTCPNLKIRTQLMVGFPGETNLEFNDTLKLIDEIQFDFIEVYKYSPRAKTLAAKMPNQVTKRIANKRYNILSLKALKQLKSITTTYNYGFKDNLVARCDA